MNTYFFINVCNMQSLPNFTSAVSGFDFHYDSPQNYRIQHDSTNISRIF
jgi:hypothetical protein